MSSTADIDSRLESLGVRLANLDRERSAIAARIDELRRAREAHPSAMAAKAGPLATPNITAAPPAAEKIGAVQEPVSRQERRLPAPLGERSEWQVGLCPGMPERVGSRDGPRSGPSPLAQAIAELKPDARAAGLIDADIDTELAACNAERRDRSTVD